MAKLGDFKTPTGASGSIFNIGDIFSLILGAIVLIFTFAAGQNIANKLNGKVPGLDGSIEQPWKSAPPVVVTNSKNKVVY